MTLIAFIPIAVAIIGLVLWFACTNPKLCELGRLLFFIGAFWAVYTALGKTIRLG